MTIEAYFRLGPAEDRLFLFPAKASVENIAVQRNRQSVRKTVVEKKENFTAPLHEMCREDKEESQELRLRTT